MAKKRKSRRTIAPPRRRETAPKPVFPSPFKGLKKMLAARTKVARKETSEKAPSARTVDAKPASSPKDDASLLREAYAGVRPLGRSYSARLPVEPPVSRTVVSEEAEVLAQLSDLISGQGRFDITETEEYVEGARRGLDPRLVTRLRKGEFAIQAHLDLHGMVLEAAKQALTRFILESVRKGLRTVLVIHGRGRGSPGGRPVLKHATVTWLSQRALSGYVLAFTTARPEDGGAGAMCVLLRRERRRAPFDVLRGAKRRD
jgi:DNA-nicking Smr family endonuclease